MRKHVHAAMQLIICSLVALQIYTSYFAGLIYVFVYVPTEGTKDGDIVGAAVDGADDADR